MLSSSYLGFIFALCKRFYVRAILQSCKCDAPKNFSSVLDFSAEHQHYLITRD
jgi:hypothetical protein